MKTSLVIAMLIIMASTQTTINPRTQACVCSNLLNSFDCGALPGCQWTPANITNSTNSTNQTLTGTCANATTNTTTLIPTFCGSITNGTACAEQVGCAYINFTCQIFTGCTAYVKTTHSDCQLISTQCTTDGTRCALPATCNTYATEAVCVGSQGITTKNCKWTPATGIATTGTCSDTVCTDAPTTLTTLTQCQEYISTCSSTGKGCVATLASCTTYLTTDGCSTRIGIEGKCIDTTPASSNCRAQVCTDASLASATICTSFLSSSTCIFNGKDCVASPLPACNTYLIAQTCDSMIGSDGKCTTDKSSATNCKLYTCADAPTSTVTDSDCQKINTSCVTNGQGCVSSPLPQCQTYTGSTSTPCTSFKGINGICNASSTATCTDRTCTDDATKTFTTDYQCNEYFKGCVTKGVGCVSQRSTCENYSGTADECSKSIGTTGNCTFSTAGQAAGSACKTKACTDAASTLKTNAECASYSFQCASNNGNGCIEPGKSTCNLSQICYDRSTCANYNTQTLCLLNTQSYSSGTTYYERPCIWGTACTNQTCPTTATLKKTDADCQAQLPGCLTNGAGCIDISADCTQYQGLTAACEKFKGVNQTIQCTQDREVTTATTACIEKNCANAQKFNGAQSSGTNICASFQGCYFDGKNNCTNQGCSTYFGTQDTCKNVANAIDDNKNKQYCWNTTSAESTTQCTIRECTHAPSTSIDDSTCNTFLPGCVTNGKGCVDPATQCTDYEGGSIDICSKFSQNGQQCTGTGNGPICIPRTCSDNVQNASKTNCSNYLSTCQFDGVGCVATNQCSNYNANGGDYNAKAANCNALKDSAGKTCGVKADASKCSTKSCEDVFPKSDNDACKDYLPNCYLSATNTCAVTQTGACDAYTPSGGSDDEKATSCSRQQDTNGNACGYVSLASKCSTKSCTDVFPKSDNDACKAYLPKCYLSATNTCAVTQTGACDIYTPSGGSDDEKATSCSRQQDTNGNACGYVSLASKCSAKSCTDVFTKTNDSACKGYLPTCQLQATTTCATTTIGSCNDYTPTGTEDTDKATFCNMLLDTAGKACGYVASASRCSAKLCTDVFTKIKDSDCKAYLPTCYLSAPSTCAATGIGSCESYATSGDDAARAALCNSHLDDKGNVCGYQYKDVCSEKSCYDFFTQTNDADCKAYLPSCVYRYSDNQCGLPNNTYQCDSQEISGYDTDTEKAAFCSIYKDSEGNFCGYLPSAQRCSVKSCDDFFSKNSDAECKAYLPTCYLSAPSTCAATGTGSCYSYATSGDDAARAALCNSHLDVIGNVCGYQYGNVCSEKSCKDVFAQTNDADCKAYLPTCVYDSQHQKCIQRYKCVSWGFGPGFDDAFKATTCSSINSLAENACGYLPSAQRCSVKSCDDFFSKTSDADCKAYLPTCYLAVSKICAAYIPGTCESYATSGTDEAKASTCKELLDAQGKVCGYKTGSNCSAKSCDDIFTKTNDEACKAYLATCYLSADSTCTATKTGRCESYATSGADATDKAAICNSQLDSDGKICGYISSEAPNPKCSAKSCDDVFPKNNDEACKAYLPTCYLSAVGKCSAVGSSACDSYKPTGDDYQAKATYCNSQIDTTGAACGFQAGASKCSAKACNDVSTADSDDSCNKYLSSCKKNSNQSKNCKAKACIDASNTIKTDADCAIFRKGCVTNGGGCLDSAVHNCADYKGDRAACQKFTGLDGPCSNTSGALTNSSCAVKQCGDNNNETSQAACDLWYPPLADGTKKCIWNGSAGCIALTTCDAINGTIDTCALVQASDKPCSGTATSLPSTTKCVSNKTICNKAPTSYTTDAQCKTWHNECLSTGFGCVSYSADFCRNIVNPTLCSSYKKDKSCELVNQCLTKPQQCSELKSAFECNNTILTGTTVTCGWNVAATTPACIPLTCELLPATLTTDSACSAALQLPNITCTTNGTGCLTKTTCSGYTYAAACNTASTTDGKKCIWQSAQCRNIICTDNLLAKSDSECDTYLKGCKTTGTGCSSSFDCTAITTAALCQKDSAGNPCLWYKTSAAATASCYKYTQCTDILQTTHAACQYLSPLCTTDGTKCIAITGCAKTILQVSCVVGTDGACGYLPASGTTAAGCALFTNCTDAIGGTSYAACQAWGSTCVSNGTSCISQTACTGYLTEAACGNLGTSGTNTQKCIFSSGACRQQVCTDATATSVTAIATHTGCLAFPATTPCTTNGTNGCIAQSTCSSYSQTLSAACVQGTDGPCFFQSTTTAETATTPASTTTACRLKQCSDILGATSASCSTAIIGIGSKCVSNGVNCIAQSTCSTYTAREACLGGGSDGACAFTPGTNETTPNLGTCQLFTACNQANQDQTACNLKSASCYFTPAPTNGTSSCTAHNCTTIASGSSCQAVPNFDLSQYQICVLAVGTTTCQPGTPEAFPQSSCYASTLSTYTWNPTTSQCQSCQAVKTPNSINNTIDTNNKYGYLVSLLIIIAFMI